MGKKKLPFLSFPSSHAIPSVTINCIPPPLSPNKVIKSQAPTATQCNKHAVRTYLSIYFFLKKIICRIYMYVYMLIRTYPQYMPSKRSETK